MDVSLRKREQVHGPCGRVGQVTISPDGRYIAIGTVTKVLTILTRHGNRPHPWGIIAEHHEQHEQNSTHGFAGLLWHPHVPRRLLLACPNGLIYDLSFEDLGHIHDENLTTHRIINLPQQGFPVGGGIIMTHVAMDDTASELTAVIGTRLLTYGEPFADHYSRADVYRQCIPERLVGQSPLGIWYIDATHVILVYCTAIFAYIPASPYLRTWMIDIPQVKALISATLSPDKTLLIGITQSGQADVYSLKTHNFEYTIELNDVPLHGLATGCFFNWDKLSLSRDDDTSLLVVAGLSGPKLRFSTFIPFSKFDPFRIMGAGIIDGKYHLIVTRPYIADPTNLNVVGLIVPDNFQRSDQVVEGSDRQVDTDKPEVPPSELGKPAHFGFMQAGFLAHGCSLIFWIVWQFIQLETKTSEDALLAGFGCGFVMSLTWILMWSG